MIPSPGKRRRQAVESRRSQSSTHTRRVWLAVGTAIVLVGLTAGSLVPNRYTLRAGQIVPRDIRAPATGRYLDEAALHTARAAVPSRALVRDPAASLDAVQSLDRAVNELREARTRSGSQPLDSFLQNNPTLAPTLGHTLLSLPQAQFDSVTRIAVAALSLEIAQRPISYTPGDLDLARTDLQVRARSLIPTQGVTKYDIPPLAAALAAPFLRPTATEQDVPSAVRGGRSDTPVYVSVRRGDVLAHRGEIASSELVDQLNSLGMNGPGYGPLWQVCLGTLALAGMAAVLLFIRLYFPTVYRSDRQMALLAFVVLTGVSALRFLGYALGLHLTPSQYGFFALMWVAVVGMLISTLIRAEIAVLVVALLSFETAALLDRQLEFGIAAFFSALAGIYSVRQIRQRSDILRSMAILAAVNLGSVMVLTVWTDGTAVSQLKTDIGVASVWALVAGVMSAVLFFVGVAVLEHLFHLTTDLTLLELCDNQQPLLRRLILEAPGTYAHSVGVASLAEAAAEAIGTQTLWVRAGALYHDVGKVCRPYFFIENQHGENLHDKLSPTMSAKVITAHIADGVTLARENRLPEQIIDYIQQHHGTSLVSYFYHQAIVSSDSPRGISETAFRYTGPRPQTREAGILMLADTVESVFRSNVRKNPGRIDAMVSRIVQNRLADGQLSECDLTLKELDLIQAAFTRVLAAIYHSRIEYPPTEAPAEVKLIAAAGR